MTLSEMITHLQKMKREIGHGNVPIVAGPEDTDLIPFDASDVLYVNEVGCIVIMLES